MSAQSLGWGGPGGLGPDDLVMLDCPGLPLHLRREASSVFSELIRWLRVQRKADRVPDLASAGGYNPRYISGTTTWSNHAWALAADFNPGANPYAWGGADDMPAGSAGKAESLGMRWGGTYSGKRDAMHFEVVVSPARLAELSKSLRFELGVRDLRVGLFGSDVTALQVLLGALPDGWYGDATAATVKTYQTTHGLTADGVVGPATLAAARGGTAAPPAPVEIVRKSPRYDFIPYPWPYPKGDYLGLESNDAACHSGALAADRKNVQAWQRGMKARGWKIATDGVFGPQSAEIAVTFQKEKRLFVDGRVGNVTWHATDVSPTG